MNPTRRLLALGLPGAALIPGVLHAQGAYPNRPIKMIVAFGPGTGSDTLARALCDQLTKQLGIAVNVENREGAGGNVGHAAAAKSPNDGYTLLLGTSLMTMAVHAVSPPPYDPVQDFAPILNVAELPMIVVTSSQGPHKTWGDFVAYAKANPGKANYVTTGKGSSSHLFTSVLGRDFGFQAQDIQYKSAGQAVIDTAAARADIFLANLPPTRAMLQGGQLRMLATGSERRLADYPDVPTFAELTGRPDYKISLWYGVFAPAGTPPAVTARLREELEKAVRDPVVRTRIEGAGFSIVPTGPSELTARMRSENQTFGKLLRELGLAPAQ